MTDEVKVYTKYEESVVEANYEEVRELFRKMNELFTGPPGGKGYPHEVVMSACAAAIGVAAGAGDFDVPKVIETVTHNIRHVAGETRTKHEAVVNEALEIIKAKAEAYVKQCEADDKDPDPREIEALINTALADHPGQVLVKAEVGNIKNAPKKGSIWAPGVGHA